MSLREKVFSDMRKHIEFDKKRIDVEKLESIARKKRRNDIVNALKSVKGKVPLIAEIKPASPKGILRFDVNPTEAAKEMIEGGAFAISVLTEPIYYRGSFQNLVDVSKSFDVPTLRKDLVLEEFQVYETAAAGASSFLLIADQLGKEKLEHLIALGHSFGMEPLVEVNSLDDVVKVNDTSVRLVGINNKDENYRVDFNRTKSFSEKIEAELIVSESGIRSPQDVKYCMQYADAVLVGTEIMKSVNIREKVRELVEAKTFSSSIHDYRRSRA